jgi:hypothetical protein
MFALEQFTWYVSYIITQISKNTGTITIGHFARVLSYLGIMVSADDFNLLVKKFMKDNYTINYIAFLDNIDQIVKYMDKNQLLDFGGVRLWFIKDFKNKVPVLN